MAENKVENKYLSGLNFDISDAEAALNQINDALDKLSVTSENKLNNISNKLKSTFSNSNFKIDFNNVMNSQQMTKNISEFAKKNNLTTSQVKKLYKEMYSEILKSNTSATRAMIENSSKEYQSNLKVLETEQKEAIKTAEAKKREDDSVAAYKEKVNEKIRYNETKLQKDLTDDVKSGVSSRIAEYARTYITYQGFNQLKSAISDTVESMKNVEFRMMEISRIMEEGSIDVQEYRDQLTQLAYDYGRSFDEVSSVTLNFARAGYSANDSLALTEKSLLALNTAELDASEATDGLISVMAQWGMDTGTTAEKAQNLSDIIDKINKTADNFPITSEGLLEALKRTSQGFNLAGATIDETIAMIVAAERASQRGGKVIGTAMANIVQQLKAEGKLNIAEELGLDFFEDEAKTTFKSVTEIFATMSEKMSELKKSGKESSTEMQKLLELFTVFRRNIGAGLLSQMDGEDSTYAKALQNSIDSIGYSAQENAKYMSTMEAATQQFNAEVLKLQNTLSDEGGRDIFGAIVASGANFVSLLNTLIDKFGALPLAVAVATAAFATFDKKMSVESLKKYTEQIKNINQAIKLHNGELKAGVITQETFAKLTGDSIPAGFKKYQTSLKGADASLVGYITSTAAAKLGTIGLKIAISTLEAAISFGITLALQALIELIMSYVQASQKASENVSKMNDVFKQTESDIESYRTEIINLTKEINDSNTTQEEQITKKKRLMEIQKELIDKFGDEAKGIDLVTNSVDAQNKSIDKLLKSNYKKNLQENEKEINKLAKTMTGMTESNPYILSNLLGIDKTGEDFKKLVKELSEAMPYTFPQIFKEGYFGNPEDVLEAYRELYEKLDEYRTENHNKMTEGENEALNKIIESVSGTISSLDEKYGESIEQYKTFLEDRLKYDEKYSETYEKMLAARAELEKAYAEGDTKGVETAKEKLKNIYNEALEEAKNDPTHKEGMTDLLKNDLDEMQKTADNYSINIKFNANNGDLKNKVQEIVTSMGDISSKDLKEMFDMDQPTEQLTKLKQILDENGITVEYFIEHIDDLGIKLGKVSENTGTATASIDTFKKSCDDSLQALVDLDNGFSSVYAAMNEFNQNGYMSASTLKNLIDNDLLQYFDVLNGKLAINEAAMANAATATKADAIMKIQLKTATEIAAIAFGDEAAGAKDSSSANLSMSENATKVKNALVALTPEILNNAAGWKELMASMNQDTSGFSDEQINGINTAINNMKRSITAINSLKIEAVSYRRASASSSGGSGLSSATKAANEAEQAAKKAAEEAENARKAIVSAFEDIIKERERLEDRWVSNKKKLGLLTDSDEVYILQESIKRYKKYAEEVNQLTAATEEEKTKLRKQYLEEAEDLEVEYFSKLKDIMEDQKKSIEDRYDEEKDAYKDMIDQKIDMIKEQAQAEIDALNEVEDENDRIRQKEEYEAKRKELVHGYQGVEYWQQRTGREAQLALAEAKKKVEDLDKDWEETVNKWSVEDQIKLIEERRDADIKATEEERDAYLDSLEKTKEAEMKAIEDKYQYQLDHFNKTGEIIQNNARIQAEDLYNIYKTKFIDPVGEELRQALNYNKQTQTSAAQTAPTTQTYTIQWGDTLSGIARKYNTTIDKILAANPYVTNRNLIYAGRQLKIPTSHTGSKITKDGIVELQAGETVLNMKWAKGLDRMLGQYANSTGTTNISNGSNVSVKGDLIKIEAKLEDKTDIEFLSKKILRELKDKLNIKK